MTIILVLLLIMLFCALAYRAFMSEQASKNAYFQASEADMGWIANLFIGLLAGAIFLLLAMFFI